MRCYRICVYAQTVVKNKNIMCAYYKVYAYFRSACINLSLQLYPMYEIDVEEECRRSICSGYLIERDLGVVWGVLLITFTRS